MFNKGRKGEFTMKKKMILILLAIAMLSTMFVACGENTTTNPNENEVLDTGVPNTDTSTPDTDTDTSTPEETPIVEGVFLEHKNGWYRCEPLENGLYKYEIYSSDMGTTYSIELPVFSEDMDFSYKWNEDKTAFEIAFTNDDFYVEIKPYTYDEVTKENKGDMKSEDFTSLKTSYFEHTLDTPEMDVYMYNVLDEEEGKTFLIFYEFNYTTKCQTRIILMSSTYTLDEHIEYTKTFSTTPYDTNGRYNNLISSIDENVTKTFGVKDISSKVKEKNLNMTVVGYYDWIRTSYVDPTLYKELIVTLYNSDYSTISKDTVVEIVKELFGDKELFVYGTEDTLSEFPTYTTESTPYFYYYVDDNLYGVVSMKDDGIFYLEIKYFKK